MSIKCENFPPFNSMDRSIEVKNFCFQDKRDLLYLTFCGNEICKFVQDTINTGKKGTFWYSPTTCMAVNAWAVEKEGASAVTSQEKFPDRPKPTFLMTT